MVDCLLLQGTSVIPSLRLWVKFSCKITHIKAIEQWFHAILFVKLDKVILTFRYVDETPKQ